MKKNKNGFTLVEIIVCIAIIAVLGVVATFGLQKVLKKGNREQYVSLLKDLNDSAKIYVATYKKGSSSGTFMLAALVESGYIDESIYEKINPVTCSNYSDNTGLIKNQIFYTTDSTSKVLRIYVKKVAGGDPYYLDDLSWLPDEVCS